MPSYIGIEKERNLLYEGGFKYGHPVWPTPVIIPAAFVYETRSPWNAQPSDGLQVSHQFREDHFDAAARRRRGRFYSRMSGSVQPTEWQVSPHPALHETTSKDKS